MKRLHYIISVLATTIICNGAIVSIAQDDVAVLSRAREVRDTAMSYAYYLRSAYLRHTVTHAVERGTMPSYSKQYILEAAYYLEKTLQTAPDVPYLWWESVALNQGLGRVSYVIKGYENLCALTPSEELYFKLASLYELRGENDKAVANYRKVLEYDSEDVYTRERIVDVYIQGGLKAQERGDIELARAHFNRANDEMSHMGTVTNSIRLLMKRGLLYELNEEFDAACDVYKNVTEQDPSLPDGYVRLAHVLYARGEQVLQKEGEESAKPYFQKAANAIIDAQNAEIHAPEVLNFAAYALARAGVQLETAEEYVQKALEEDAKNGAYLDTLGWIYFQQGRLEEALEKILYAYEIEGDDPVIADHLAEIYLKLGKPEKAREMWEKSLQMDADNEHVRRKLELLK